MFERTDDTARFARRLGDQRREAVPPQPRCLIRCLKRSPTKPYVAQPTARARNTNYLHLQANHPALGESGLRFTRERSLVRNQPRPFRSGCIWLVFAVWRRRRLARLSQSLSQPPRRAAEAPGLA